jgi:hypothetical protein
MKITKRQLRRIVKEEKEKLLSEMVNRHGIDISLQRSLDDFKYTMEKELVAKLSIEDRKWWKDEKKKEAVLRMLDTLKETINGIGR